MTKTEEDTEVGSLNLDCFTFPSETETAYKLAAKTGADGKANSNAVYNRNRLEAKLIATADASCHRWWIAPALSRAEKEPSCGREG